MRSWCRRINYWRNFLKQNFKELTQLTATLSIKICQKLRQFIFSLLMEEIVKILSVLFLYQSSDHPSTRNFVRNQNQKSDLLFVWKKTLSAKKEARLVFFCCLMLCCVFWPACSRHKSVLLQGLKGGPRLRAYPYLPFIIYQKKTYLVNWRIDQLLLPHNLCHQYSA